MLLNCGAGEDFWDSLGLQGDQTSQSLRKLTLNVHWKVWWWIWSSNILPTWCEEPIYWNRPWCWERLKAKDESGRGWDGLIASLTQWTWIWANSGRQWRAEEPGVHDVRGATESQTRVSDRTTLTRESFPNIKYRAQTEKGIILNTRESFPKVKTKLHPEDRSALSWAKRNGDTSGRGNQHLQ